MAEKHHDICTECGEERSVCFNRAIAELRAEVARLNLTAPSKGVHGFGALVFRWTRRKATADA